MNFFLLIFHRVDATIDCRGYASAILNKIHNDAVSDVYRHFRVTIFASWDNICHMEVKSFDYDEHIGQILAWIDMRGGKSDFNADYLPPTGLVISGIAALFWWNTNGPVVLVDGVIANPEATASERRSAVSELFRTFRYICGELGIKRCLSLTRLDVMREYYAQQIESAYVRMDDGFTLVTHDFVELGMVGWEGDKSPLH